MKIIKLTFILFVFIPLFFYGQKEIRVKKSYEKGWIANGYKKGVWEYYDAGVLKLKVDYSTGKLIYLAKDTTKYAVETGAGWQRMQLDIYPHYIGSMDEILKIMATHIRYPRQAINHATAGTVFMGFEINLQGHADSIRILKDIGDGCGKEVVRVFKLIPDFWLVARKGEKQYRARFVLPVRFQIGQNAGNNETKKTFQRELEALGYFPTNVLPEIVVSISGQK